MPRHNNAGYGILLAGFAAGPLVLLISGIASLYLRLPAPIVIEPYVIMVGIVLLPIFSLIGAVIAVPVNAIGSIVMQGLARHVFWARSRPAWALAGGLIVSPITGSFDGTVIDTDSIGFGVVATAMVCGLICHRHAYTRRPRVTRPSEPGRDCARVVA